MSKQLQDQLATRLGGQLATFDDHWRGAFMTAPRHEFLPARVWQLHPNGTMTAIDRETHPDTWLAAAYSDDPIVTRLDGHTLTSSCSMPLMVFGMLEHLAPAHGQRILEIGTGTGWNAGLLTARFGPTGIYTIEVDPEVAAQAAENLERARLSPAVITGDGELGLPGSEPFDRIIATCAVNRIPPAWISQSRPGGVIVTPWASAVGLGGLLRLVVGEDGMASGPFVDTASFMWLRAQGTPPPDEPDDFEDRAEKSHVSLDLSSVRSNLARFAVGLMVPDAKAHGFSSGDTIWILANDSWASVDTETGTVRQLGKRRLWDEVETAHAWWTEEGSPDLERFGVTVANGRQAVWLDDPANTVAEMTTPKEDG